MTIHPCIVIPCYNHGYALEGLVETLERYRLPIIIVNDGSTDSTAQTLERVASRCSLITIVDRPHNGGKGAALTDGLAYATAHGYSHALLIDSDGQHASDDIPRFLKAAEEAPESLILGSPQFGREAPLARRLGREVSNIFVALVTMRCAARDVLCGFRVYPLKTLNMHVQLAKLQPRMGFDSEILVRALWEGLSVVNLPTKVVYPVNGVSHFRYGADNLQLARLYIALSVQALYRVPLRWFRGMLRPRGEQRSWYHLAERGSLRGLRLLLLVLERIGRIPLLVLLGPVVLHMFAWGGAARRAALQFQRHISTVQGLKVSSLGLYARALRQFWEFGLALIEKAVSWREGIPLEKFTWVGRDEVRALLNQGRGVICMGAHVGNTEVIRALGETRQVVVNALMFTGNSRHFRAFLEEINATSFLRVIDLSTMDPSMVFDLQERLDRGEIVALLGDRATKHSVGRVLEVPFLGRSASFPEGPWILASLLNAPVYTVFSMRERAGRYRVEFTRFADRISLPRATRRDALVGYISEFSSRLGDIALRYPYQWFNFYQFWPESDGSEHLVERRGSPSVAPETVR